MPMPIRPVGDAWERNDDLADELIRIDPESLAVGVPCEAALSKEAAATDEEANLLFELC